MHCHSVQIKWAPTNTFAHHSPPIVFLTKLVEARKFVFPALGFCGKTSAQPWICFNLLPLVIPPHVHTIVQSAKCVAQNDMRENTSQYVIWALCKQAHWWNRTSHGENSRKAQWTIGKKVLLQLANKSIASLRWRNFAHLLYTIKNE